MRFGLLRLVRALLGALSGVVVLTGLLLSLRAIYCGIELSSPVPFWDQWDFVDDIPRILHHNYGIVDLLTQHNEHRIATSRIIYIIDLLFFDFTSYFSIACIYMIVISSAAVLACIGSRGAREFVLLFSISAGLLLSICQWENLSWGFQPQFPLVHLFALASLWALASCLRSRLLGVRVLTLAAACCFDILSIFSLASGILLILPVLVLAAGRRRVSIDIVIYAVVHVLACLLFFYHYAFPTAASAAPDLATLLTFFLSYVGSPFRAIEGAPVAAGLVLTMLYAIAVGVATRQLFLRRSVPAAAAIALALATFVMLEAAATAHGRAGLGSGSATSSRYTFPALVQIVSLIVFYFSLSGASRRDGRHLAIRTTVLCGGLASMIAANQAVPFLAEWKARSLILQQAGYDLLSASPPAASLVTIYPDPAALPGRIKIMREDRLGPFSARWAAAYKPPLNTIDARQIAASSPCTMAIDASRRAPDGGQVQVTGWISGADRPTADGFLLAFDRNDRLVGFTRQLVSRPDVAASLGVAADRLGFTMQLDRRLDGEADRTLIRFVLVPSWLQQPSCAADQTVNTTAD